MFLNHTNTLWKQQILKTQKLRKINCCCSFFEKLSASALSPIAYHIGLVMAHVGLILAHWFDTGIMLPMLPI
jgi:hypothetical protein